MKRITLLFFCFSVYVSLYGQNQIASPRIFNYTAEEYKGGVQNWGIAQDKNGLLYFGNKEGLVTFNGKYWNRYPLPNYTVIRSLKVDSKNRIFVGGQDEFGYFFPDKSGVLKFHSFLNLIPVKERKMADLWNIAIEDEGVFFRAKFSIFQYKDGAMHMYRSESSWDFLGSINGKVFAQSREKGIMSFDNGVWNPVLNDPVLQETVISFMLPYNRDTILVGTLKRGLFLMAGGKLIKKKTAIDEILLNNRMPCGVNINNNWIALGTTSSGVIIIDKKGEVIQRFSLAEGLQKENVRAVFIDHNGSMWLGLDDGIDMVAINSAIKYIYPDKSKQITYSMRVFNNKLYVCGSNALYYTPLDMSQADLSFSKGQFKEIKNLSGQAWNLDELNNHLVIGHEEGLFTLNNENIQPIYFQPGTWLFQPVSNVSPFTQFIVGTYNGLQIINYSGSGFKNGWAVEGINESLRFIVYDNSRNIVWASHPYHGIYKLQLSADLKRVIKQTLYTKKDGLPSTLYNYIYYIHNRVAVATSNGIYEYDAAKDKFTLSPFFEPYFNHIPIIYLKEDNDGNVWFVTDRKEVGVVELKEERKGQVTYFPEIKGKIVGGFESIYPYDSNNIFIGAAKGVLHINYRKFKETQNKLKVLLGQVKIVGQMDSTIYGGYFVEDGKVIQKQADILNLRHNQNFLHFEFASTLYNEQDNIQYSCFLEGIDKDWSVWGDKTEKDYTSLPAGNYTFKVKARNNSGMESEAICYKFSISPVWYRSIWSYLIYISLLLFLIYRLFKWQRKKHLKEQEKLHYLNQLELDKTEKEIIRLKNEKLESDIDFKNRELANMVMHLVQRGKVIEKIKDELAVVSKNSETAASSSNFKRLLRLIAEVEKGEKDWEQFTHHFNNVHANFFKNLQHSFPELTANELKLCAFIKMNLSTKEIAHLMNITIKAVEVARYRLRKKLLLNTDTNLYSFLLQIADTRQVV